MVRLPAPVRAIRVDDISNRDSPPGSYKFFVDGDLIGGMNYRCPCGCGMLSVLPFKPEPSPSWEWDRNWDAPTLTPSVHHVGHWHGYLRGGFWTDA